MCGLAGFLGRGEPSGAIAAAMADAIVHRGPDDGDIWVDAAAGLALAHRRLSILDLSPAGHQPMQSASGHYVLAFNGEIYNHLYLRGMLDAQTWRGHSDTETLLACIEAWGIEITLTRLTGMFAFALWDKNKRELVLARDRLGEKPLYYVWQGDVFLFGSELKALAAHPAWRGEVDRDALALFMRYGYVPQPWSIWLRMRKLLPGSYLTLSTEVSVGVLPAPTYYWRARDLANAGLRTDLDDQSAAEELDGQLRRAVAGQMVADVPLGAFLSGGVDSSAIVALMQQQSSGPVRSFSIGFAESDYDEAVYAKAVAVHLGTDHTELYVTPADALAVVPRLPEMFDEPFGDSSQIPTHLVAMMARRHVTVSLSGDGGDELFGGYNRYFWGRAIWRRIGPAPRSLRGLMGRGIVAVSPRTWDRLGRCLLDRLRQPMLGDRMHKLADVIDVANTDELYRRLTVAASRARQLGASAPASPPSGPMRRLRPLPRMPAVATSPNA
jgi:asparagine synthase (glutamine-hydrolysing)